MNDRVPEWAKTGMLVVIADPACFSSGENCCVRESQYTFLFFNSHWTRKLLGSLGVGLSGSKVASKPVAVKSSFRAKKYFPGMASTQKG